MKSYFIDELTVEDLRRIRLFLNEKAISSGVESLFWVQVSDSLLTPIQQEHPLCRPHVFAVETGERFLKAELYVRTLRDMRCACQGYSTPQQSRFLMEWVNEMLKDLSVKA